MKHYVFTSVAISLIICLAGCSKSGDHDTKVKIQGEKFLINGEYTFKGKTWRGYPIEGLLPNSRMVNGIFDDLNDSTSQWWAYPDTGEWSAQRNTDEFVENMKLWRDNGLLAFTINMQGGSPEGYSIHRERGNCRIQPWINSAIDDDGNLREAYLNRLEKILDKADKLEMAVILGIYYFGQEHQRGETSIKNGIKNTVYWVLKKGYGNVLIEINNESNYYEQELLLPDGVHELIRYAKSLTHDGNRLLVGTSFGGGHIPPDKVIEESDFILLHGNGIHNPEGIVGHVNKVRQSVAYTPKPIVYNEDDHFDFDSPMNNFIAATSVGASWGYFDFRMENEGFDDGYQSIPVNWGISSKRKEGFFRLLSEWGK